MILEYTFEVILFTYMNYM